MPDDAEPRRDRDAGGRSHRLFVVASLQLVTTASSETTSRAVPKPKPTGRHSRSRATPRPRAAHDHAREDRGSEIPTRPFLAPARVRRPPVACLIGLADGASVRAEALGQGVLGAGAAFGRREAASLRRDRAPALTQLDGVISTLTMPSPRSRPTSYTWPGTSTATPRRPAAARRPHLEVVRLVVARAVPGGEDGRELVEVYFPSGSGSGSAAVS
jgi:hypothetical protein